MKEHLSLAPHSALRVIYPFSCDKENSFNMAGYLKSHVEEHHKDAALAKKHVSKDELVWLSYNLVVYRNLMEPTDRNVTASSRLGSLLLGWTRKILAI